MKEAAYKATYGEEWKEKVNIEKGKVKGRIQMKNGKGCPKNSAQWWDEECTKVVSERKKKYQEWRRNKSMENFILYKKAKAQARKTIKSKKREDF